MFFKKTVAYCLSILVLLVPLFVSAQTAVPSFYTCIDISAYSVSDREFVSQSSNLTTYIPSVYSDETINSFISRCYRVAPGDASDFYLELYSYGNDSSCGGRIYFFDTDSYTADYDDENGCYIITGLSVHGNNYNWSWSGNAGISNNSVGALLYYPDCNYFVPVSIASGAKFSDSSYSYFWRSNVDFSLPALSGEKGFTASSQISNDIFSLLIDNQSDISAQYVVYISRKSAVDGISESYKNYSWSYKTLQNVKLFRQSMLKDLSDTLDKSVDIFGEIFNPTNCWRIPLSVLFSIVPSDSDLVGCYSDAKLQSPYHFIASKNNRKFEFKFSDVNVQSDLQYYLNVIYRPTIITEVALHHRSTYSYCYYDSIEQLDSYSVALSVPFTLSDHVYNPVLTDSDGNPITDDKGEQINYGSDYSDDIYNLKGYIKSSNTAIGGSASVINNNSPVFNNTITVGGGSGSGTVQDFDDVDVSTFENLWDSCGNFFDFIKKIWTTFPLQASFISACFVTLFVLRIARR